LPGTAQLQRIHEQEHLIESDAGQLKINLTNDRFPAAPAKTKLSYAQEMLRGNKWE
jgi:hypothetical protein